MLFHLNWGKRVLRDSTKVVTSALEGLEKTWILEEVCVDHGCITQDDLMLN